MNDKDIIDSLRIEEGVKTDESISIDKETL
jgi:hypothetical protein